MPAAKKETITRNDMLDSLRGGADEIITLFYLGYRAGTDAPNKLLDKLGFGRPHHRVLFLVARQPGITITNLIDLLGVSRQALHRPLRELVAQGYMNQKPAPTNRRLAVLTLTPKGAALEAKLTGTQYETFARAFAATGPESEKHWKAVMRALAMQARARAG